VSRCARLSVWSGQKAQGEATVRLTLAITIGARAPAGVVQHLVHQQQALRRGGGEHACAGQRRRDAGRHHRVLGLGRDDLGVELAGGLELGQLLQHRCLRRDRVHRHHLRPRQPRRPGHGVVAGQQRAAPPVAGRVFIAVSSSIAIEPLGHSRTHTPQPLQ
jgi:hypothetical protein